MFKEGITNAEKAERQFAEEAWLMYLNQYLRQSGVITEKEYELMIDKITASKSSRFRR